MTGAIERRLRLATSSAARARGLLEVSEALARREAKPSPACLDDFFPGPGQGRLSRHARSAVFARDAVFARASWFCLQIYDAPQIYPVAVAHHRRASSTCHVLQASMLPQLG